MKLSNRTPLAARLKFGAPAHGRRPGLLMAKATYFIGSDGQVSLDDADPVPILESDLATPLGLLPRDDLPHALDCFQVLVLGSARSPRSKPVTEVQVKLSVGDVTRALRVVGDRRRTTSGTTVPEAFVTKPLTWANTFGGRATITIDRDAVIDYPCPDNPYGKGFDATLAAAGLARELLCPPGYPKVVQNDELPNIVGEIPDRPVCWATTPFDTIVAAARMLDRKPSNPLDDVSPSPRALLRAHPDWVIERPPAGARVSWLNLGAADCAFKLPALRVIADFALSTRSGRRELIPFALVVLADEMRFYLAYKRPFSVSTEEARRGGFRLRIAEGWRASERQS